MVFIRVPTFKTAIAPSMKHRFNQAGNYTPTEKLTLTRNRIWGNIVGGNVRSGYKELKKPTYGHAKMVYYNLTDLDNDYPFT